MKDHHEKTYLGFWKKYVHISQKLDWLLSLICVVSIVFSLMYVVKIKIKSDFRDMLPDQYRSVIELNRIDKRLKSSNNLIVLIGGENWPNMRRFINDLVFRVKTDLPELTASVEYNTQTIRNFYDSNKYLYIDLPDLKEVHRRLKQQIDYEKIKESPFYISFEDEPPKFDISDIEDKYTNKTSNYQHYEDGYFTNEDINLAAIIVKPREAATNADSAEVLIGKYKKVIESMDPTSYDPTMKVGFGGRYVKVIDQYRALIGDILKTLILCVGLVGILLLVYFKRFRMGTLLTMVVLQGTLITLALTNYKIGYLTSQTAFLGSIIVGNGINYAIVVLSRYLEERKLNLSVQDSMAHALATTWRATLTSSITTSAGFAVLAMTKIKGFSQFGAIGGVGMLTCWITTFGFLPATLLLTERILPMNVHKISVRNVFSFIHPLSDWVIGHHKKIVKFSAVALVISVGLIAWYLPRSLEYDFSKLKFKPEPKAGTKMSWEENARENMSSIFGQSTTPSVVLVDSIDEAKPVCAAIEDTVEKKGLENIFDECKTIYNYIPKDQEEKLSELSEMRDILSGSTLGFLTEKEKREVDKFRETFNLKEILLDDIPEEISANYEEIDGTKGKIVYIYSDQAANLWDGKNLIKFADLIREVDLPDGKKIYSSGEPVIFADLLQAVVDEGPRVTLVSFLAVILLVVVNYKRSMATLMMCFTLSTGIIWMIAVLALFNIKLNFINFVALPISFGIGVDYGVNIYQRYMLEGKGSMGKVIKTTGVAVIVCSLTTVIGYMVLVISSSRALRSFGYASVIGEMTCLTAALIAMPALVHYWDTRQKKKIK